ncbi:MAG: hypothetical protein OZ921_21235 [Sorangiineae bacterium]|nr:hypothetical protein [Polyangiaceae bacterium]MEB2325053.1 hypothetical protein [Sorangiineae bacterium]
MSFHFRTLLTVITASLLLLVGCGNDGQPAAHAGIDRGPAILDIEGDPNGLWWDDASQTLYVADDDGNRLLRWTDEDGFSLIENLTAAPEQGAGLGQLVSTSDGTLVVTRFGHGTAGAVVFVPPSGGAQDVPGLAVERRRIGLTIDSDGKLYDSWFVRQASGERVGAVGALSLAGTESEIITGLQKPVGVLAVGENLFVSDQDLGQVLRAPLSNPSDYEVLAAVPSPDLLAAGPNGSLFIGSEGGSLYRIEASGAAAVFQAGFDTVRGMAYDPTNRRVFVVNHVGHEAEGVTHTIHILPVD